MEPKGDFDWKNSINTGLTIISIPNLGKAIKDDLQKELEKKGLKNFVIIPHKIEITHLI